MTAGRFDPKHWTTAGPGTGNHHVPFLTALGYRGKAKIVQPDTVGGSVAKSYAQQHLKSSSSGSGSKGGQGGAVSKGKNVQLGKQIAAKYGWNSGRQWMALDMLFTRESGWSNTAKNANSGAYGIAQALGHGPTNQYPAGAFKAANPAPEGTSDPATQIRWGLEYIRNRYGTPLTAWEHEQRYGWY